MISITCPWIRLSSKTNKSINDIFYIQQTKLMKHSADIIYIITYAMIVIYFWCKWNHLCNCYKSNLTISDEKLKKDEAKKTINNFSIKITPPPPGGGGSVTHIRIHRFDDFKFTYHFEMFNQNSGYHLSYLSKSRDFMVINGILKIQWYLLDGWQVNTRKGNKKKINACLQTSTGDTTA